jgi:hypothetical protein
MVGGRRRARSGSRCGEDVLQPLHVRPIGQEEEVVGALPEDVDRSLVCTSGLAPTVGQDGKVGKLLRDGRRDWIDVAVHNVPETPDAGPAMRAVFGSAHLIRRYARSRRMEALRLEGPAPGLELRGWVPAGVDQGPAVRSVLEQQPGPPGPRVQPAPGFSRGRARCRGSPSAARRSDRLPRPVAVSCSEECP